MQLRCVADMHVRQSPFTRQACHGCLQMVVTRLQSVQRKSVRDLLVNVVATALHYNAEIAVAALQQQGQLAAILSTWFQVNIKIGTSFTSLDAYCAVLQHQSACTLSFLIQVTFGLLPCVLGEEACAVLVEPASIPLH